MQAQGKEKGRQGYFSEEVAEARPRREGGEAAACLWLWQLPACMRRLGEAAVPAHTGNFAAGGTGGALPQSSIHPCLGGGGDGGQVGSG